MHLAVFEQSTSPAIAAQIRPNWLICTNETRREQLGCQRLIAVPTPRLIATHQEQDAARMLHQNSESPRLSQPLWRWLGAQTIAVAMV
jgi:hypothetical protein